MVCIDVAVQMGGLIGKLAFNAPHQEGQVCGVSCEAAGAVIMITGSPRHTGL